MPAFGASAKMQPPSAPSQAFDAARSARPGRRVDAVPLVHRLQYALTSACSHASRRSAVGDALLALPNLNNVPIRIANVAARLTILFLWLGDEFSSSTSPKFVACVNIRNAEIHEAADCIRIGRDAERYRWFVGCRTAADVDDEPRVRDLKVARRALAVASAQN